MVMKFQKATRKQAKLRLGITGPSGSGKTMSSLLLAKGMGGRIAVCDTERSSASLYSHVVEFDALDMEPPFSPERFITAVDVAEEAGYDILILDSITHEWSGIGGCLELVDEIARAKYKGNSWSAWNDITPRHRAFLDRLMASPLHIIATMRSKTETAQVEENGRKKVVKLGMKAEQRDGAEYEFTVVLDLVHDGHYATASKDRTGLFSGDPKAITPATGKMLIDWLNSGEPLQPEPEKEVDHRVTPRAGAQERVDVDRLAMVEQYIHKLRFACDQQSMEDAARISLELKDPDEETAVFDGLSAAERRFIKEARKAVREAKTAQEAA